MGEFPFGYERIAETTWAYLSSLIMLALFFKFNRFWSVRNLDLFLIILLAPGVLMIQGGNRLLSNPESSSTAIVAPVSSESDSSDISDSIELSEPSEIQDEDLLDPKTKLELDPTLPGNVLKRWGYVWLFGIGAIFLIRMLIDPRLVRRPMLEPNLTVGGLTFMACTLMMFLFANIVTSRPSAEDLRGARDAVKLLQREAAEEAETEMLRRRGPGYTMFNLFPVIPSFGDGDEILKTDANQSQNMSKYVVAAKSLAITSQVFLVIGMVLFGYFHFNSFRTGVGMAVIYLMLPYTAVYTGYVLHILPAALLVWALVCLRRPMLAGTFVGMAIGVTYYPLFLLPLWMSFYWEKGVGRFVSGVLIAVGICIGGLIFTSVDPGAFLAQLQSMFGFWIPIMDGLEGIWALGWDQWFRLPIMVAFVALCISFAFWPNPKNVGTLMGYTCAVMVGVQFWHGFGGGEYIAWWVPMALMTIFRPNLDGRVATFELTRAEEQRLLKANRAELAEEL